jgi:hypothetical protein
MDNQDPSNNKTLFQRLIASGLANANQIPVVPRFDHPKLPQGTLSDSDKWKALLWNIKTAEAHGHRALQNMVVALTKIIQAEILTDMFFDTRLGSSEHYDVSSLFWCIDLPIRDDGATLSSLLRKRKSISEVSLSHASVIPQPWERWRMARSFQNLGKDGNWGEWMQNSNIYAVAWTPWPILWVSNGNHSTMAAIVTHGGLLKPTETYDATSLLKTVHTDGLNWMRSDTNEIIAPVRSMAMAAIFEIGKILLKRKR